jgi:hypothetical protein
MPVSRLVKWGSIAVLAIAVSAFAYAGAVSAQATPSARPYPVGPVYNVTFNETGLAAGTNWSVSLSVGGGWHAFALQHRSDTSSIVFSLPNGTYRYRVGTVPGYALSTAGVGSVVVNGTAPATVDVAFAKVPTYAVTFTETGLPASTNWTVRVAPVPPGARGAGHRDTETSSSDSISFSLANGTYRYHVVAVPGYAIADNGSHGRFNVTGASPAVIAVTFVKLATYAVTFQESGLAAGTNWTLGVFALGGAGGGAHGRGVVTTTSATTVTLELTNGTYGFFVGYEHGYKVENGSFGHVVVSGASPAVINVTFVPWTAPAPCAGPSIPAGASALARAA